MIRRPIARHPITHNGDTIYPYEVELPEQDMDLDRLPDVTLADAARLWCAQVRDERAAS